MTTFILHLLPGRFTAERLRNFKLDRSPGQEDRVLASLNGIALYYLRSLESERVRTACVADLLLPQIVPICCGRGPARLATDLGSHLEKLARLPGKAEAKEIGLAQKPRQSGSAIAANVHHFSTGR